MRKGVPQIRAFFDEATFTASYVVSDLDMPRLMLPSVQVNMRGGRLPEVEDNGTRYLKMPVNAL